MDVKTRSSKVRARARTGLVSAGLAVGLATVAVAILPPSAAEAGGSVSVDVSGTQIYGGNPSFSYTTDAPGGIVSGMVVCTTVDGGTPITSSLASGPHTVDGSSCSGLSSSDPTNYPITPSSYSGVASGFVVSPFPVTVEVSGLQGYGQSPSFTYTTNAPGGIVSGTPVCTMVNGGTPIAPTSALGSYTVDGSSCSGLTSSDQNDYPVTPGSYGGVTNGFVVVNPPGVWGPDTDISAPGGGMFLGVSCSGATDCTAVGFDNHGKPTYATESSGTWGPVTEVIPGGGQFNAVSCNQPTACTAVGSDSSGQPIFATETSGTWGPVTEITAPGGGRFNGVSCSQATDCTAVGSDEDGQPVFATETSGTWGPATELTGHGGHSTFNAVSCSTATDCTAVGTDDGNQPDYTTESSGIWGPVTHITAAVGSGYLNGVSCSGATDCTAVGSDDSNQPISATETSGTWGPATEITEPTGSGFLSAVSCSTATDCTAVGGDDEPIETTESSGTWSPTAEVPPPGGFGGVFNGVSCSDATECTGVGFDVDSQPFYATSAPAPATIDVSGTQVYGGSPNVSYTVDAPPGVVSGTLVCMTVDGGTPISPALAGGLYTIDGSSCTGLVSSDPTYYPITAGSYNGVIDGFVVAPPVVSEVDPATGFTTGTDTVTIVGSGFVNGSTTVDFGAGNPGTNVDVASSTTLTVSVPAGAAGTVDVTVTSPGGTSTATPADQYTYTVKQTVPQTEFCSSSCPTNTETNALNQTSVSVAAPAGSPFGSTSLIVNTDTLSCGASKNHNYDYPAAVSTLSASAFPPQTDLTVTETVGNEPTTKGVAVCFGVGPDPASGTLLHACKKMKKAPCLETLTEASGSIIATFLSPAIDPRFWTGAAAPALKTISPLKGVPGSTVTIKGKNLTGVLAVVIGGATAAISSQSTSTKLIVTVPSKAVTGLITVTAGSGEAVSAKPFTVT